MIEAADAHVPLDRKRTERGDQEVDEVAHAVDYCWRSFADAGWLTASDFEPSAILLLDLPEPVAGFERSSSASQRLTGNRRSSKTTRRNTQQITI